MNKSASVLLFVCAGSIAIAGDVAWDESVNGDLSNDGFNTTSLGLLANGSNRVLGTTSPDPDFDPDYFSFEIGAGQQLVAIILERYAPEFGGEEQSFFALQAGPQVTSDFDTSVFLGATLIGGLPGSQQGENFLDDLESSIFGGQGFSGPLGPGVYSVWFQETAQGIGYTFDFVVVPSPASIALLGAAGLTIARRRR